VFGLKHTFLVSASVTALLLVSGVAAVSSERPKMTVDLQGLGLREGVINVDGSRNCNFRSPAYRSVGWLDNNRIVVAFNSTPECSSKPGKFTGMLKVAIVDLKGKLLRTKEIAYETGWTAKLSWLKNGGVSVGTGGIVIVEFTAQDPNLQASKSRLLILSSELSILQEIDVGRGSLAGLTKDGSGLMVWSSENLPGVACRIYTGVPFKQAGTCPPREDGQTIPPLEYRECASLGGYDVYGFSEANEKKRAVLFGYKSRAPCADLGIFCSTTSHLFVCDTGPEKARFQLKVVWDAAAALSPDGTKLGVLQKRRLELYLVP
jgi:hypothetical protein